MENNPTLNHAAAGWKRIDALVRWYHGMHVTYYVWNPAVNLFNPSFLKPMIKYKYRTAHLRNDSKMTDLLFHSHTILIGISKRTGDLNGPETLTDFSIPSRTPTLETFGLPPPPKLPLIIWKSSFNLPLSIYYPVIIPFLRQRPTAIHSPSNYTHPNSQFLFSSGILLLRTYYVTWEAPRRTNPSAPFPIPTGLDEPIVRASYDNRDGLVA